MNFKKSFRNRRKGFTVLVIEVLYFARLNTQQERKGSFEFADIIQRFTFYKASPYYESTKTLTYSYET